MNDRGSYRRSPSPQSRQSFSGNRQRSLSPVRRNNWSPKPGWNRSPSPKRKAYGSPETKSLSPWKRDPKGREMDPREKGKSSIVDKMLQIAGQSQKGRMSENSYDEVRSRDDRRGGDKKSRQPVSERVSVTKSLSEKSVKERIPVSKTESVTTVPIKSDTNVSDGKDVELFEARKRKFEASSEVSVEKKKISLKGIIPSSKEKQSSKGHKEGNGHKRSRLSSDAKEKKLSKDNRSEKSAKKTSSETSKGAKITPHKRKSRESVKSVQQSDSEDSDEDSRSSSSEDSESNSDEDTWRNKKAATSERNQDDIERERRKRLEAVREKEREEYRAQREERRKKEEEERKKEEERRREKEEERKRQREERKKSGENRKDSVKTEKRERVSNKGNRESKVKEHRKKQFVEMEGSDDEESATRNKSVPMTSIVLPTKRTDSANNQKISRRIVSRDNEDDDAETRRKLSKTDARHLIRTTNKSSKKEDGGQEEEIEDSPKSSKKEGKASPVVIFQYDTVKQKLNPAEDVSTSRLSVHARLGLPVDAKKVKKNKRTVREVSPETKSKTTPTHRRTTVISTKKVVSGETGNLDARIKLIKKRNVEIEKRENEIKKDREIFG